MQYLEQMNIHGLMRYRQEMRNAGAGRYFRRSSVIGQAHVWWKVAAGLVATACVCLFTHTASANNLTITNETLQVGGAGYTFVKADICWDNSWKASWTETHVTPNVTVTNWDAAWIFVKYRVATNGAPWQHASLSTNNSEHIVPGQAMVNVGLSTNAAGIGFGTGVFLYRSAEGGGNWTNTVKLRWNYLQDGVATTERVDVSVHAIEMVYVPQGSFYVGDGTADWIQGQFCSDTRGTVPFQITNENYTITLGGGEPGSLGNHNAAGMYTADDFNNSMSKELPAAFPKGYNAFYCMKYEISQGQWVNFFNMLTVPQKTNRDLKNTLAANNRITVSWAGGVSDATLTNSAGLAIPDRACGNLCWADGEAYADWAGLRPMTELEFEKACRGPLSPVANEYAWGTINLIKITGFSGTDGSGTETAFPANANCAELNSGKGPLRCGIYATASSGRESSGATYWGIMEMSSNLRERTVNVGNPTGRAFTGALGDGTLDEKGYANTTNWLPLAAYGSGTRGGWAGDYWHNLRSSDRKWAANYNANRSSGNWGFRGVRQAP